LAASRSGLFTGRVGRAQGFPSFSLVWGVYPYPPPRTNFMKEVSLSLGNLSVLCMFEPGFWSELLLQWSSVLGWTVLDDFFAGLDSELIEAG
jgi:hypothetical protein